jgi:DedD protein
MWSVRRSFGLGYTETKQGMETRLKERLTGAAILVALIVALVPEMFRGQHAAQPANSGGSGGEEAPVRTYTIDLSNNPKNAAPLQPTSEAAAAAAPAASVATPAAATTSPVATAPAVPAAAAAPPAAAPALPPRSNPPAAAAPRVARAPAASSSSATQPAAHAAAPGGNWSVQLGLFSRRENAERMMNEAKAKGFSAAISGVDAKGQFHVHVTGLTDRNAAAAMAQKMKGEGLPAAVVAP